MKYIPLYLLIQLVNLCLLPLGLVVCLSPSLAKLSWIFWNSINPPMGDWWASSGFNVPDVTLVGRFSGDNHWPVLGDR